MSNIFTYYHHFHYHILTVIPITNLLSVQTDMETKTIVMHMYTKNYIYLPIIPKVELKRYFILIAHHSLHQCPLY